MEFYYQADGSTEWATYTLGSGEGCFGVAEGTPIHGWKGWVAFPVQHITYRWNTGSETPVGGDPYPNNEFAGVQLFWVYDDSVTAGAQFVVDELQQVKDYKVFADYK